MNATRARSMTTTLVCALLWPALCGAAAKQAPDFGASIDFDRRDTPVQLSDFRGKAAMLVFFQSW